MLFFTAQICDTPVCDPDIIEKIADEMEKSKEGIEYYFSRTEKELLPKGLKCSHCKKEEFKKGQDILDVWFDSGIQHSVFEKKRQSKF